MRNILTIAMNTVREVGRQPAFLIVLALGTAALLLGRYLTLFGLGMEVEMYKDIGASTMLFTGFLLVVFAGTSAIFEEIESKTILTVLSRPVTRPQLLVGKFTGIVLTVSIAFVLLTLVFLVTHWWFLKLEYSHSVKDQPFFHPQILKAVALVLMQVTLIAGVSVILSIFVGLLPNISICGLVFILGHLSDYIFSVFRDPVTGEMSVIPAFFYAILPNLGHYNISTALVTGIEIPASYLLRTGAYTLVYLIMLFFIGNFLFHRRELL
jgi:ABC-type transport system involved in multi-copper enzyme maturation permease subunit